MFFKILLLFVVLGFGTYAEDCPEFTDITKDTLAQKITDAESILNFTKYDTADMKFYIITPSSYPNFVNPEGESVDWSSLDCDGKPAFVNCHGFREFGLQVWAIDLVRTYVANYGGCAVSVDYKGATENLNYLTVVTENTVSVGRAIADYVADNICKGATDCTEQLQLHGHSWGAHTCGIAGYELGKREPTLSPARMMASDAAGPYFNKLNDDDYSSHLSPKSGKVVINIKTSKLFGSSKTEWAQQTQFVGDCGTNHKQCGLTIDPMQFEMCHHKASVFVTKSTMQRNFPAVKVTKCDSCHGVLSILDNCIDEQDNLGWKSEGKPGIYVIRDVPGCLNVTIDSALHE